MTDSELIEKISQDVGRLFQLVVRGGGLLGDPEDRRLTNTQSLALMTIVTEGPLRLWALAERMLTTDATATRTVDALVDEGLARREVDLLDKRGVVISATPKGTRIQGEREHRTYLVIRELLSDTSEAHLREIASFLADLNETITESEQSRSGQGVPRP